MKKTCTLFLLLLCFGITLFGQKLNRVQGEVLVQLSPEANPRIWAQNFERLDGQPTQFVYKKLLSAPINAYSFSFDFTQINEYRMLQAVKSHPQVVLAQFNHLVTLRAIPDDPQFIDQWQYINTGQSGGTPGADIDIEEAWDVTTGGLTVDGDSIVVCAIDGGLDLEHEDFEDNHWLNHAEIPGNGVDDDNNGYIDDYRGWNINTNDDDIDDNGGHGTAVAGIMGAKGNNGIGVAGVSWNVKVMVIKNNFNTDEAAVLEAYTYPLVMRMRYNETNGAEGAFVVATNASWGVDLGDPEDAPLWCSFYDTLGVHGILSCGATINGNVDVDIEGDLPTACPSDYLITVTNMNDDDEKVTGAGFGTNTIDLGAFGADTWTTDTGNGYDEFGGTSGATPHVTGTIGLLYAAPCPAFMAIAKSDPSAAALLIKQYILGGVDPNESLDGITVSGGRLNVNNSMQLMLTFCGDCPPATSLEADLVTDTSALLSWNINDSINRTDLRWRAIGDTIWTEIADTVSPIHLTELLACTTYEFQVKPYCNSDTLDYGNSEIFKTDGCCELPDLIEFVTDSITDNQAALFWTDVTAAESYNVWIRPVDSEEWLTYNTNDTFFVFTNLPSCTFFEVQLQTLCADTMMTEFSLIQSFRTLGCGPCVEADYCAPVNLNGDEEWIGLVEVGLLSNTSASDDGYGNYTTLPTASFQIGETYPVTLDPDFSGFNFSEDFHIWIDLNQDTSFTADELVYESSESTGGIHTGELTIPANAALGNARMRVVMQFQNVAGSCEFEPNSFGEVEDYCIEIVPEEVCITPANFDTLSVGLDSAVINWEPVGAALSYIFRLKKSGDAQWTALTTIENGITLTELEECQEYEAQVRTICGNSQGVYTPTLIFDTDCLSSIGSALTSALDFKVYPNPFSSHLMISFNGAELEGDVNLQLINPLGKVLQEKVVNNSGQSREETRLSSQNLPTGVYLVRLTDQNNQTVTQKVVKL